MPNDETNKTAATITTAWRRSLHAHRPVEECPYRANRKIICKGLRRNKYGDVQAFYCRSCRRQFTPNDHAPALWRIRPGAAQSGLLVVPQHVPLREVVDDLILTWTATDAEEWVNRVVFLRSGFLTDLDF